MVYKLWSVFLLHFYVQLVCAGAIVAAGLSFDNILELRANSSLTNQIDDISDDIRMRAFATVIIPIVSSLIIPLGVIMIIISLFKIDLGACRKLCVATVRQTTNDKYQNLSLTPTFTLIALPISRNLSNIHVRIIS